MSPTRGYHISFSGVDGAGKSTQKYISRYVDKRFNEETLHVLRYISLSEIQRITGRSAEKTPGLLPVMHLVLICCDCNTYKKH